MTQACEGIRVLDFTHGMAGTLATMVLADYGAELQRVTKDGGWLFLLSQAQPPPRDEPLTRYRLLADDLVVREVCDLAPRRRWVHPTREIERALAGFSIQGIHLQRNQMREIVAFKAGVGG